MRNQVTAKRWRPRSVLGRILGTLFVALLIFLTATSRTHTPAFKSADGNPIKTSIAEERRIVLGGVEQYVLIRSLDHASPLLIFLHGGPGFSAMPFNRLRNAELEEDFIFVNWDQRGAGYSYLGTRDAESLTLEQIVRDLDNLVKALCDEFDQDKVLLIGHSWGSLVGLTYAHAYPENVAAYIGVSQFSDVPASEVESYEWAISEARKKNDDKIIAALERIGRPPYESVEDMWTQGGALNELGGVHNGELT